MVPDIYRKPTALSNYIRSFLSDPFFKDPFDFSSLWEDEFDETDDKLIYKSNFAGFNRKDDWDIKFDEDSQTLSISVKRGDKTKFVSFPINSGKYQMDKIKADIEDGILTIEIPKKEGKKISIEWKKD